MGRRFDLVLALDGSGVLALTASAFLRRRAAGSAGAAAPLEVPLWNAGVAVAGWLAAAAARRALAADGRIAVPRAARLVRAGLGITVVGTATLLAVAARSGTRRGARRCLVLLVGGTALSAAYLRVLGRHPAG